MSENKLIMQCWSVAGALDNPKGIRRYAKVPNGQVNMVIYWSSGAIEILVVFRITIQEIVVLVAS